MIKRENHSLILFITKLQLIFTKHLELFDSKVVNIKKKL